VAYVRPFEEEAPGQPVGQTGGASQMIEGGGGGASPGVRVNRGGSQFSDISRYINQNKQAGERYASQLGGQAINEAQAARTKADQDARQRLGEAESSFGQAVNKNSVPYNQDLVNRVAADPRSLYQFPSVVPKPQAKPLKKWQINILRKDPTAGVLTSKSIPQAYTPEGDYATPKNQADIDAFRAIKDAKYEGPTDLQGQTGYTDAENAIQNVFGAAGNANPTYAGRGPSVGAIGLDSALLRRSGAANILSGAQNIVGGENQRVGESLQGLLSSANTRAKEQAGSAASQLAQGSEAANEAVSGILPGINKSIDDRVTAERAQYIKSAQPLLGRENVTNEEDYQKLAALNALMGSQYTL